MCSGCRPSALAPTQAAICRQLHEDEEAEQDQEDATIIHEGTSAVAFITSGLNLEEQQYVIQAMVYNSQLIHIQTSFKARSFEVGSPRHRYSIRQNKRKVEQHATEDQKIL
jgi:hypothetical protein